MGRACSTHGKDENCMQYFGIYYNTFILECIICKRVLTYNSTMFCNYINTHTHTYIYNET